MRKPGEVAHTVPLVYQPTQLVGGTMTSPEGALLPLPPYTMYDGACYTSVCKLATVYTVTKPKGTST